MNNERNDRHEKKKQNEEKRQIYRPENDFNGGRERIGMGVMMARFLHGEEPGKYPELEESLKRYASYVTRELVDGNTGRVFNDAGRDDSFQRLYNAPWAATFFTELYRLWKEEAYLTWACRGGSVLLPGRRPEILSNRASHHASYGRAEKSGLAEGI